MEARDLNRGSIGLEYLYVDKTNVFNAQNFKVVSLYIGLSKIHAFFSSRRTVQHQVQGFRC